MYMVAKIKPILITEKWIRSLVNFIMSSSMLEMFIMSKFLFSSFWLFEAILVSRMNSNEIYGLKK